MMRENIWGLNDCDMPDGSLCKACCTGMGVVGYYTQDERSGYYEGDELRKAPGISCKFLDDKCSEKGWCTIYNYRPLACMVYHCSESKPEVQCYLLDIAARVDGVNQEIVDNAKTRICGQ